MIGQLIRWLSGPPAFRVYGKTRRETDWRIIDVYATDRRNLDSRWPLFGGKCTCWSADLVAVGWDFAETLREDPRVWQISREHPVQKPGFSEKPGFFEVPWQAGILAHEIGHTGQARRFGFLYLPIVGAVTLFGEGPHWWNRFENEASAEGQFGGIVPGSVQRLP